VIASADASATGRSSATPSSTSRCGLREHVAHARDRLDRDDPQPARHERARELAGAGGHVHDGGRTPSAPSSRSITGGGYSGRARS